jgi:hypothetical protein
MGENIYERYRALRQGKQALLLPVQEGKGFVCYQGKGGMVAIQVPKAFSPYMRGAGWYAEKLTELGLSRVKIRSNSFLCSLITAYKP